MATRLSSELERELRAHAARDYPHECCGVLLGTIEKEPIATYYPQDRETCDLEVRNVEVKTVQALRPLENVHEEGHERRYLIAPQQMFELEREARTGGQKILGFYHSHPDHPARPSEYDREWAWPWYTYIIVAVEKGTPRDLTAWTLNDDRAAFEEELLNP